MQQSNGYGNGNGQGLGHRYVQQGQGSSNSQGQSHSSAPMPNRSSASTQSGNSAQRLNQSQNGGMFSQSHHSGLPMHQQQPGSDANHQWQPVSRPWSNPSPEASQNSGFVHNPGQSSQDHSGSIGNNGGSHARTRLTQAELGRFNQQHTHTTSMDIWAATSQREGPWDGVGQIRHTADDARRNEQ